MRCDNIFISKWSRTLCQLSQELGKTVHVGYHIVKTLNFCCSAPLKDHSGVFGRVKTIPYNIVVKGLVRTKSS